MQHVFIIGSKGIPANYGGYETFVEKLTENQASHDIKYHVACAVDSAEEVGEFEHNGAHPKLYQTQSREKTGRSRTDDHCLRRPAHIGINRTYRGGILSGRCLVDPNFKRQIHHHLALTRVDTAAQYLHMAYAVHIKLQPCGHCSLKPQRHIGHFRSDPHFYILNHRYRLFAPLPWRERQIASCGLCAAA